MEQRVSFITLAVPDLAAARAFFLDGLGWEPVFAGGEVLMIRVGERLVLSLWAEAGFEAEVGPVRRGAGRAPVTIAHNVSTPAAVDAVLADAERAGATIRPAVQREWGGYSGYFFDPAGFAWEVAYNPGSETAFVVP